MAIDPKSDPASQLKASVRFVYFIAVMNLIFGAVILFGGLESFKDEPGWPYLIFGMIIGIAGYLTEAYRSKAALAVAVGMFALDGVLTIWMALEAGEFPPIWALCLRIALIILMASGFNAINAIHKTKY